MEAGDRVGFERVWMWLVPPCDASPPLVKESWVVASEEEFWCDSDQVSRCGIKIEED